MKRKMLKAAGVLCLFTVLCMGMTGCAGKENEQPDLSDVHIMLPVVDGLSIIKAMRNKKMQIPIIIITGMSELQDKIEGLDNGADDYLTKPFHISELSARIIF